MVYEILITFEVEHLFTNVLELVKVIKHTLELKFKLMKVTHDRNIIC